MMRLPKSRAATERDAAQGRMKLVAVVVPLPTGRALTSDETVSLRHIEHFLGHYDRYFLAPEGMAVDHSPGFQVQRFPGEYFGSAVAHNTLLLQRRFYQAFRNYRFILICHLDALVFSDQLTAWCQRDWDFIGAPWFPCKHTRWMEQFGRTSGVGNGGFSLRKVEAFLRVLGSKHRDMEPDEYWRNFVANKPRHVRFHQFWRRWLKHLSIFNNVRWSLYRHRVAEDIFWAFEATRFDPAFRVAPVEEALRFAWETEPRRCFEMTGGAMPFGCHAWPRYDRGFWIPHLIEDARATAEASPGDWSGTASASTAS
ncbi:MAG TPA: DUF5672 family protein [Gemmatimonadales bacterium]|nr:DUF5672 family protein [Gemmatimonadales bacterium]